MDELKAAIAAAVLCVLLVVGWTWFQAAQEAAAYRRVTGRSVSTWDAVWLDLRVMAEPDTIRR